jgi:CTP synthase (UTP-ammonia lyase)
VAIVGDFDRGKHSHWATEAALFHAAARLGVSVAPQWFATDALDADALAELEAHDAIWVAPGSPYASAEGALRAIKLARTRGRVFLGTCAGFQHALIEFTRNVLGIADADSAENVQSLEHAVITLVQCAAPPSAQLPRLHGAETAHVVAGSWLEELCGPGDLRPEYFCSYEVNAQYIERWQAAGLRVAARGAHGEMRALELPDKRFFIATLFQPQLSSSYVCPHPIVLGFVRAALTEAGCGLPSADPSRALLPEAS